MDLNSAIKVQGSMPEKGQGKASFTPQSAPFNGTPVGGVTIIGGITNNVPVSRPGDIVPKGQLVGFLYSVSKTMAGEYWPLYLGANMIGRGVQNNIVLSEGTISENHASIHTISRQGSLVVYITDSSSKTGTLLNGSLLRGEADLKSGDILTVGEHYQLLVILIDQAKYGLAPVEGFVDSSVNNAMARSERRQFLGPQPGGMSTVIEGQVGSIPMGGHTVVM